ncbi:DUF1569 domain-containing protein [Ideonella margarita]|uniref:DUF1569 domain-containing protein n=1 Tax=Ideonella margarita TaxID=2984191 RepID=A0ABU9C3H6_9BURK
MNSASTAERRHLLGTIALGMMASGSALTAGCSQSVSNDRQLVFATLKDALQELTKLPNPAPLPPATALNWAQTLTHCAQSIEFSMTGFPKPKSALFQRTVGSAAFQVFAWRGRMSHDLAEPIPGAPELDPAQAVADAQARLRRAVDAFEQWTHPLQPHFAYGELSKPQFEQAHAMHLAQHLSAFHNAA